MFFVVFKNPGFGVVVQIWIQFPLLTSFVNLGNYLTFLCLFFSSVHGDNYNTCISILYNLMVQLLYGLALINACKNYASMSLGPYARPIESESLYFFFLIMDHLSVNNFYLLSSV